MGISTTTDRFWYGSKNKILNTSLLETLLHYSPSTFGDGSGVHFEHWKKWWFIEFP